MEENIAEKINNLNQEITEDVIKNASNEELIGYLFLEEKMKKALLRAYDLEEIDEIESTEEGEN